jgi:TRAP-type C4-dicarboxylate transport system permease small subunit
MDDNTAVHPLKHAVKVIIRIVNAVGAAFLVCMMLLVVADVSLRFLFNRPVEGSFELVEFMMAIVVCMGMAYCGMKRGHTTVEFLVSRFSEKTQHLIDGFNSLVSAVLFALISWGSVGQALMLKESESITTVLEIPLYPFLWVLAVCSGLLGIVFLLQTIEFFMKGRIK